MNKKILAIFTAVLVFAVACNIVIATTDPVLQLPGNGTVANTIKSTTHNVWGTVATVVQILSVAAIVFAGLRYMFASADQKADIKQGLIYLTIGCVLVFGASIVIQFVASAAESVLK